MTPKQRLLAAINGKPVDRLPWSPFLAYYWESLPEGVQAQGQLKFLEDIGADPLLRGAGSLHKQTFDKCSCRRIQDNNEMVTVYETPAGKLESRHKYSPAGNTWFTIEHPVKSKEDFKILTCYYEDMYVEPGAEAFLEEYRSYGDRALMVPCIGTDCKTSFQSLIEYWVGTEELVYALADYPEAVEESLQAMRRKSVDTVKTAVDTPAEAFIFWEDSSTTNISPSMFDKYAAPEINDWAEIIHNEGKYLIHHACGHLRGLLPLIAKTGIDVLESVSPPPTGNIEIWDAREALPEHIGLIGGIEPTAFLNSTVGELEGYVKHLMGMMGKKRYVLANSDSCPPGVSIEKFRLVTELVRR